MNNKFNKLRSRRLTRKQRFKLEQIQLAFDLEFKHIECEYKRKTRSK